MNRLRIAPAAVAIIVSGFFVAVGFQNCAPSKLESLNGLSKVSSTTLASTEGLSTDSPPRAQDCIGSPELSRLQTCPAGQAGAISQIRRVISTSCLISTGENTFIYTEWVNAANTCNLRCTGEPVVTQQVPCEDGQSGMMTQTRTVQGVVCGNNGNNIFTYSAWSTASNQCSSACTGDPVLTQQKECPSPYVGKINERRTLQSSTCVKAGSPNNFVYGPWYEESNTCVQFSPVGPTRTPCSESDRTVKITAETPNELFLRKAYCNVLGGYPDQAGFKFYLDSMSRGVTRPDILVGFATSDEYFAKYPGFMNDSGSYYDSVYRVLGNRLADPAGLEFWRNGTNQATSVEAKLKIAREMVKGLMTSPNERNIQDKWGL